MKHIIRVAPFYGSHIVGYLTFTPNNNDDDTAHLSDSQFLLSKQEEAYENHCYIWGVIIFFFLPCLRSSFYSVTNYFVNMFSRDSYCCVVVARKHQNESSRSNILTVCGKWHQMNVCISSCK